MTLLPVLVLILSILRSSSNQMTMGAPVFGVVTLAGNSCPKKRVKGTHRATTVTLTSTALGDLYDRFVPATKSQTKEGFFGTLPKRV